MTLSNADLICGLVFAYFKFTVYLYLLWLAKALEVKLVCVYEYLTQTSTSLSLVYIIQNIIIIPVALSQYHNIEC